MSRLDLYQDTCQPPFLQTALFLVNLVPTEREKEDE